jgi:hypothetical protein
MPGAADLEDAWIRARAGGDGYLTGKDAEAAACDAQTVPVVTGTVDGTVLDQLVDLARQAAANGSPGPGGGPGLGTSGDARSGGGPGLGTSGDARSGGDAHSDGDARSDGGARPDVSAGSGGEASPEASAGSGGHAEPDGDAGPGASPALARQELRHAMARLAIDLVSGPTGIASALRRGLLDKPYNTPSLPLDIGRSHVIPGHIRRAVLLRDRTCAWPKCDRPAAHCDVHHLRHQKDGGETSLANLSLLCQYHHDVCIHRNGWQLLMNPDGTTEARSPDGTQVLHTRVPPNPRDADEAA